MRNNTGFTLVEIAIVIVIIGLLIGGVMKGQELIRSSAISAYISQLKEVETAVRFFKNKYGVLPGDMTNPDTLLPGCDGTAGCDQVGDGNTKINGAGDASIFQVGAGGGPIASTGDERVFAWSHLAAAGLVGGVNIDSTTIRAGEAIPAAKINNTMMFLGWANVVGAGLSYDMPLGTYLISVPSVDLTDSGRLALLSGGEIAQMDRKIDDGNARTGVIVEALANTNCRTATGGDEYLETRGNPTCNFFFRLGLN
ncbi:MAG: prepilin-type N-terminal cleavage/methylation domain-containing protein [Alphaproteobacteria bacterium]|nr:prepilin-type N-terminal cleavage/methylation domain-containing protein [Alphaproteobacteria bacterium]